MCNCKGERPRLVRMVEDAWRTKGERWAVIENKSGMLELVPEKQIDQLKEIKINYTLKN